MSTESRLGAAMDLRFEESVQEFAAYVTDRGLDHVELKREYLHAHPDAPTPHELAELGRESDVTFTLHAPFRDWNLGSFNDASRRASVEQVKRTLDDAAAADAGAVVVHGGSVPRRYPDHVHAKARQNAVESLRACAEHAAHVGVPLCLENQPRSDTKLRHTTTPDDLDSLLTAVDADPEWLRVTLDVGHAKVNGFDWRTFADRFGNRIEVVHLHDNDGTNDDHEPLTDYETVVSATDATYHVFEMKRVCDVDACLAVAPSRLS
ncbi:Sugar phosphate isomerase/epimerase [Halogranum rubrum]|uniref:Sugar phosphate isomerase/epimerase n=1 Tax=Halogranum rubrum TaxID=553466 RepID=A0A1I4BI72_9EURY|nr:sugar phosphate isomerase/epimerase family protein [Halogranum rubrum]SFK68010.1 Sugar phosphate isomerase/epimerase [Halogranum rubrum]